MTALRSLFCRHNSYRFENDTNPVERKLLCCYLTEECGVIQKKPLQQSVYSSDDKR